MCGLRLDHHHPQLIRGKVAFLLHSSEQLLVVEVTIAEVVAQDHPGDQLPLAHVVGLDVGHRAWEQAVQRAAVRVHRAEGKALVQQHLYRVTVVEFCQLLTDDRRRLDDRLVELLLGGAVLAEQPLARRPVARVIAHRR